MVLKTSVHFVDIAEKVVYCTERLGFSASVCLTETAREVQRKKN